MAKQQPRNSRRSTPSSASSRHLKNSQNINRLLMVAAVVIVVLVFIVLHYQNKGFVSHTHHEVDSHAFDLNYYSGNKAFDESYKREKALENQLNSQNPPPGGSEVNMNISAKEQLSRMEETLRKAKAIIHEEQASETKQSELAAAPQSAKPSAPSFGLQRPNVIRERWSGGALNESVPGVDTNILNATNTGQSH